MVTSLPHTTRLKLTQTLGQWRRWSPGPARAPTPLTRLSPDSSNINILVEHSGRYWVVRLDGIDPQSLGINRQVEYLTLQRASHHGIAPRPVYSNPDIGVLVCEYIDDQEISETADPVREVGLLLQQIHTLPAVHFRLNLGERLQRYERAARGKTSALSYRLAVWQAQIVQLLGELHNPDENPVLCHNDLHHGNRLRHNGALVAIDWEYCAMGDRYFDLAVVCVEDALSFHKRSQLLLAYGVANPQRQQQRLARYCQVYRYLALLWYCATDQQPEPARVERYLQELSDFS